jgi:hypothetical protein
MENYHPYTEIFFRSLCVYMPRRSKKSKKSRKSRRSRNLYGATEEFPELNFDELLDGINYLEKINMKRDDVSKLSKLLDDRRQEAISKFILQITRDEIPLEQQLRLLEQTRKKLIEYLSLRASLLFKKNQKMAQHSERGGSV